MHIYFEMKQGTSVRYGYVTVRILLFQKTDFACLIPHNNNNFV